MNRLVKQIGLIVSWSLKMCKVVNDTIMYMQLQDIDVVKGCYSKKTQFSVVYFHF